MMVLALGAGIAIAALVAGFLLVARRYARRSAEAHLALGASPVDPRIDRAAFKEFRHAHVGKWAELGGPGVPSTEALARRMMDRWNYGAPWADDLFGLGGGGGEYGGE